MRIAVFSFLILSLSVGTFSQESPSPFGMCINMGSAEATEKAAQWAVPLGVKWMRQDFPWYGIEPEKGKFQWGSLDAIVDVGLKHGISTLGIVTYAPPWIGHDPSTDEERELFANFVSQTVLHFKGRIRYWEIWNEPNIGTFWKPRPNASDYAKALKAAYQAAKRADPDCKLLGPCTLAIDAPFIEKVLAEGAIDYFDILSVHPYRDLRDIDLNKDLPDVDLIDDLQEVRRLMAKYGSVKPIWITEMGRNTSLAPEGEGISEEAQANYSVKMYVVAFAGGVEKFFQYHLKEGGEDPYYTEQHYGVLRRDWSPKPSYFAVGTLIKKITGLKCMGNVFADDKEARGYLFSNADSSVLVLWAVGGTAEVDLPVGTSTLRLTDREGRERTMYTPEGIAKLVLTESPVYLEGFDREQMKALAKFSLSIPWLQMQQGEPYSLHCTIENVFDEEVKGTISVHVSDDVKVEPKSEELTLVKGAKRSLDFQVTTQKEFPTGSAVPVTFAADLGSKGQLSKTVHIEVQPEWLICGPFPNPKTDPKAKESGIVPDTGLATDYLLERGGEHHIEPEEGWTHSSESVPEKKVKWQRFTLDKRGFLDFRHTLNPNRRVVAYAFSYLHSDVERTAVLKIGSDDGMKIWLNHQLVFIRHIHRGAHLDQEQVVVKLKKGMNPCLVKVDQGLWAWGFYLQVN